MINLKSYLQKIKAEQKILINMSEEAKSEYLQNLYVAHVLTFPYSNFKLREIAVLHPVQRPSLSFFSYEGLLSGNQGGYCYQNTALLADALKQLGFEVAYCAAHILIGAQVNDKNVMAQPPTHVTLKVTVGSKEFLLDPGLGSSAPRFPILITGSDEVIQQQKERFRFRLDEDVYVLETESRGTWFTLLQTNLKPLSQKEVEFNLSKLGNYPLQLSIRDDKTVVGILTPAGRKTLFWNTRFTQLKYTSETEEKIVSFEEASQLLKSEFGIKNVSAATLESYCKATVLPLPQKPWTIDFPIDEKGLLKNLTCAP